MPVAKTPVGQLGECWHNPDLATEAVVLEITGKPLKLQSNHSRASHFNLPKWQTAIIAQNDIHSCMTTFNTLLKEVP